jgi:hypothetical protein
MLLCVFIIPYLYKESFPLFSNLYFFAKCSKLHIIKNLWFDTAAFDVLIWKLVALFAVTLCGHSHGSLAGINPHHSRDDVYGQILDCGVENALDYNGTAFFDIEEVDAILKDRPKAQRDHH